MKKPWFRHGIALAVVALWAAGASAESSDDVDLTQAIRRAITSDSALSAHARNVGIEAEAGVVTLSGVVATDAERAKVENLARRAGATRIESRLTVDREIPSEER